MPFTNSPKSNGTGRSGCRRENARSRCVSSAPPTGGLQDGLQLGLVAELGSRKQLAVALNHREKIVEIVSDSTRQLPYRLHLLRLVQSLLRLLTPGQFRLQIAGARLDQAFQVVVCFTQSCFSPLSGGDLCMNNPISQSDGSEEDGEQGGKDEQDPDDDVLLSSLSDVDAFGTN